MGDTRAFAELEKREWSEPGVAGAYASGFAKASDMVVPHLVAAVDAGPDTDALDLCCGHGNVYAGLVAAGARVTGLDFSAAMLELARAAVPGARFVNGDAMQLSFPDASFDAVTVGFGMPHVPEPPRVVAEARRVLRPGGRITRRVSRPLGYRPSLSTHHGHPSRSRAFRTLGRSRILSECSFKAGQSAREMSWSASQRQTVNKNTSASEKSSPIR